MGFSTLLDILGSTIVGGMLLLILFRMNDAAVENNYNFSGEKIVQQNLTEVVRLLEYDFRKIGYCKDWSKIPDPTKAILYADSNGIRFLTDIVTTTDPLGDGVPDEIYYYIDPNDTLTSQTPNPNDVILYRVVNNETPKGANLGITKFKLTYYDALGNEITNFPEAPPLGISTIQIDIAVENPYAYGNDYSFDKRVIWRQIRLAARNLGNR
ncbi:hypothetical protein [Melioribacter sp. OK-6-Me]|uniref:hypothetical protein n=1 Tax=unclassified Melioribacter TaxID=2627329 RepID=UPI003EDA0B57